MRRPPSHLGPTPLQLRATSFPCPPHPYPLSLSAGPPDDPLPPSVLGRADAPPLRIPHFCFQSNARSKDDRPPPFGKRAERDRQRDRLREREISLGKKPTLSLRALGWDRDNIWREGCEARVVIAHIATVAAPYRYRVPHQQHQQLESTPHELFVVASGIRMALVGYLTYVRVMYWLSVDIRIV